MRLIIQDQPRKDGKFKARFIFPTERGFTRVFDKILKPEDVDYYYEKKPECIERQPIVKH